MAQTLTFAAVMVGILGFISAWNMSLNRGVLQMQVDDHMRGRIMSIDMMSHGLMPLGVIPISIIAEQYDVAVALIVAGGAFVVTVVLLAIFSKSVRRVDDKPPRRNVEPDNLRTLEPVKNLQDLPVEAEIPPVTSIREEAG